MLSRGYPLANNRLSRKEVKLNDYERSIDEAVDLNKLKKPSPERLKELKTAAAITLKTLKDTRANIRINGHDMHLYLTDQLVNLKEVKKMAKAGVFGSL